MVFKIRRWVFLLLLAVSCIANANTTIMPGQYLFPGQSVTSGNGKYKLIQQGDGNLVLYRNDGVVMFATYAVGAYTVLQSDGNLVQYNSSGQPVWATYKYGSNAYILVQDNGDLAVYSNGSVLWHIGPDPDSTGLPGQVGDVAARDMTDQTIDFLGHLAIWTGSKLVESNLGGTNSVRYVNWADWRVAAPLWGIARPNIPGGYFVWDCFQAYCNFYDPQPYYAPRASIAARAYQHVLLGADYAYGGAYTYSRPAEPFTPATRGQFRCDTFVKAMFRTTTDYNENAWYKKPPAPIDWAARIHNIDTMLPTPANIWNALKN